MCKLIMLGVGNGGTEELYNTCFVIQNDNKNFLVDMGGSIEILKRLKKSNIDYKSIKNIFISHSHTDHILGLFWFFKKISRLAMHGEINEKINIFCNDEVYTAITEVAKYILPNVLMEAIYKIVGFNILKDGDKKIINDVEYTFFDIKARGTKQFGFEVILNNKKLVFFGDETINEELYNKAYEADYVMHEAFCLDSEENVFHAYEKHHSTVKSVCKIMNELKVKNLVLYHTEEFHKEERKTKYLEEGSKEFDGNLLVPDDLEIIDI